MRHKITITIECEDGLSSEEVVELFQELFLETTEINGIKVDILNVDVLEPET